MFLQTSSRLDQKFEIYKIERLDIIFPHNCCFKFFMLLIWLLASHTSSEPDICICELGFCSLVCVGLPVIDPRSDMIYNELDEARGGSSSLRVLFADTSQSNIELRFELSFFSKLNTTFIKSNSNGNVNLHFVMQGKSEYNDLEMYLYGINAIFETKFRDGQDLLQIKTLETDIQSTVTFNSQLELIVQNLKIALDDVSYLKSINFSGSATDVAFYLRNHLKCSFNYPSMLEINDFKIMIYIHEEINNLHFFGIDDDSVLVLKNDINARSMYNTNMHIESVKNLIIAGTWGISQKNATITAIKGKELHIVFDIDIIPFDILFNNATFLINTNTTFLGDIHYLTNDKNGKLQLYSNSKDVTNSIKFDGVVNTKISLLCSNLDIHLNEYDCESQELFPISFAIDRKSISKVYIYKTSLKSSIKAFAFYCCFNSSLSFEENENLGLIEGTSFVTMPLIEYTYKHQAEINADSPSNINNVPGFSIKNNNLKITYDVKDSQTIFKLKSVDLEMPPKYICIFDDNIEGCPLDNGWEFKRNLENEIISDLYISGLVPKNTKEVNLYINCNRICSIDFTSLDPLSYNVTIKIESSNTNTSHKLLVEGTEKYINFLYLSNISIENKFRCLIKNIYIGQEVLFKEASFGEFSYVIFDEIDLVILPNVIICNLVINVLNTSSVIKIYILDNGLLLNNFLIKYEYYKTLIIDSFDDLDIIFNMKIQNDIGFKQVKGFSTVLNQNSRITLYGPWESNAIFTPPIVIDSRIYELTVVYTKPGQGKAIVYKGTNKPTFIIEYERKASVCMVLSTQDFSLCKKEYTSKGIFNELSKVITHLLPVMDSIQIEIFGTTDVDFPTLEIGLLRDKRICIFSGDTKLQTIMLNCNTFNIEQVFTSTKFENMNIQLMQNNVHDLCFGELELKNCVLHKDFKALDLKTRVLFCEYKVLSSFLTVIVLDSAKFVGEPSKEEVSVQITKMGHGPNFGLECDIYSTNISIDPCKVVIDSCSISINSCDSFDIRLFSKVSTSSSINIKYGDGNLSTFPKVKFDTIINGIIDIKCDQSTLDDLISFSNLLDCILIVESNAPISILSQTNLEIVLKSSSSITGPIYHDGMKRHILIDTTVKCSPISLKILTDLRLLGSSKENPIIFLNKSNIKLTINRIDRYKDNDKFPLSFINSICCCKVSSITITDKIGEVPLSNVIYLNSLIKKDDFDETKAAILTNKFKIFDILRFYFPLDPRVVYINSSGYEALHGFKNNSNIFKIITRADRDRTYLYLHAKDKPSSLPFTINYINKGGLSNAEIIIADENSSAFNDLTQFLPPNISKIEIMISDTMMPGHPIDFNQFGEYDNLSVNVIGESIDITKDVVCIIMPLCMNININFNNLIINQTQKYKEIKDAQLVSNAVLNLSNCDFLGNNFIVSNSRIAIIDTDVYSLGKLIENNLVQDTFSNKVCIRDTKLINFLNDSWMINNLTINICDFDNIYAECWNSLFLCISFGTIDILGIHVNVHPDANGDIEIVFGGGWNALTQTSELFVETNNANVNFKSSSFPLPQIFSFDPNKEDIMFFQDKTNGFGLNISFEDMTFEGTRKYNLSLLHHKNRRAYSRNVTFVDKSGLTFADSKGVLYANDCLIERNSSVVFGSINVSSTFRMKPNSQVNGSFSFNKGSTIELQWEMGSFPKMNINSDPEDIPDIVKIEYVGSSTFDHQEFNNLLYLKQIILINGKYDCIKLNQRIQFEADVQYFNATNNIFQSRCYKNDNNEDILYIIATREIPIDIPETNPTQIIGANTNTISPIVSENTKIDNPNVPSVDSNLEVGTKTMTSLISGIIIIAFLVVALVIGLIVYIVTKKYYEKQFYHSESERELQSEDEYLTDSTST